MNADTQIAAIHLEAAYSGIHRVLDTPRMSLPDQNETLSAALSNIAAAYRDYTGRTIGEALGWGKP